MTVKRGQRVEIVSGISASDFQENLNKTLQRFDTQGIKYDMQLSPQTGFVAYIVYENVMQIAETIKDEFEMRGEKHACIECPYYTRPIDGRVKYTRCRNGKGICRKDSDCCNDFYEKLLNGEIELNEVMIFEKAV